MKGDDETSSAADDRRDLDREHLSTPSPDTSEYGTENEVEGSSVADEVVDATGDDDEEDDDDDDDKKDCGGSSDDSDETKLRRRQDVAQFLREFCLFSQTLAPQNRDSFFKVSIFILNEYMLPF